jgi:Mrp family chromosome partitioning ATPase
MASALHVTISLAVLSQHYDLVLVDTGPLCEEPSAAATLLRRAKFSGALLVQDLRQAATPSLDAAGQQPFTLAAAADRLQELRVPLLGVIENFSGVADPMPSNGYRRAAVA